MPVATRGRPSARLVIGVPVVDPRRHDQVVRLDEIREDFGELMLVVGDSSVG